MLPASWHAAIGAISVLALVATACGDDDDKRVVGDDRGSGDDRGAAGSETTAGGGVGEDDRRRGGSETTTAGGGTETTTAGGSAAAPTGEPIKVMRGAGQHQLPPYPNIPGAAKVYAQYINDKGGIAGHPLEVITCDDKGDANEAANCARQAVDQKVAPSSARSSSTPAG